MTDKPYQPTEAERIAFEEAMASFNGPMALPPEISIVADEQVITYKGVNYYRADPDEAHIVRFNERTFDIQHPLIERVSGRLFDCPMHTLIAEHGLPESGFGEYRARFDTEDPLYRIHLEKL